MGRGRPKKVAQEMVIKGRISKQDRRDLKTLADDFGLLHRKDVREIIDHCNSYAEGQQKIMRIYMAVYM